MFPSDDDNADIAELSLTNDSPIDETVVAIVELALKLATGELPLAEEIGKDPFP